MSDLSPAVQDHNRNEGTAKVLSTDLGASRAMQENRGKGGVVGSGGVDAAGPQTLDPPPRAATTAAGTSHAVSCNPSGPT